MRKVYKEPKSLEEMGKMMAEMQIKIGRQEKEIYKLRGKERVHEFGKMARKPVEDLTKKEQKAFNKVHARVMERYGLTEDDADEYMEEY